MIDITEAIAAGVESARIAEKNMREIEGVISNISSQISSFTSGKVRLEVREAPQKTMSLLDSITVGKSLNLGVFLCNDWDEQIIARMGKSEYGYPCRLSYNGQLVHAGDSESLALAFADLFKTHRVGTVMLSMQSGVQLEP
jgi:hypothetical protein